MITSTADREFLRRQFPEVALRGLSDSELDRAVDAWFAHDHYDNNPAYSWSDDESLDQ